MSTGPEISERSKRRERKKEREEILSLLSFRRSFFDRAAFDPRLDWKPTQDSHHTISAMLLYMALPYESTMEDTTILSIARKSTKNGR